MAAFDMDKERAIEVVASPVPGEPVAAASSFGGSGPRRFLSKVGRSARILFSQFPRNAQVAAVRAALGTPPNRPPGGPLVAVECVEDPIYFGLFGALTVE